MWPTVWKSGDISPVFKKLDETDKTCYHSVSVLTALLKIYERVMFNQVYVEFYMKFVAESIWIPEGAFLLHRFVKDD